MTTIRFVTETFRFSVLDEISCGFAVFGDFLRGFSVSNRPLRPLLLVFSDTPKRYCMKILHMKLSLANGIMTTTAGS